MAQVSRKYNFQPGKKIKSAEVNDELNQLVSAHNVNDARVTNLEGGLGSNFYTKTDVDNIVAAAQFGTPPLGGVHTEFIHDEAVTTAKIAPEAVTLDKLQPGARAAVVAAKLYAHSTLGGF